MTDSTMTEIPLVERLLGFCADWDGSPLPDQAPPRLEFTCGEIREAAAMLKAAVDALEGMLRHSCVADSAPEDKDAEDHAAERAARNTLASLKQPGGR